ncbi:MAG TPA: TadE/TadG family type IV pilus assembly protein [Acidimicrobiales bacterium]
MTAPRLRGDGGAATTELVLVAPALLFTILLTVQLGLYFHAISVASAAAQEGAHDASLQGATLADGEDTARGLVQDLAPRLLAGVQVDGRYANGGDHVRMTVAGQVSQVVTIPGVDLGIRVDETAETPVERFRPAGDVPGAGGP